MVAFSTCLCTWLAWWKHMNITICHWAEFGFLVLMARLLSWMVYIIAYLQCTSQELSNDVLNFTIGHRLSFIWQKACERDFCIWWDLNPWPSFDIHNRSCDHSTGHVPYVPHKMTQCPTHPMMFHYPIDHFLVLLSRTILLFIFLAPMHPTFLRWCFWTKYVFGNLPWSGPRLGAWFCVLASELERIIARSYDVYQIRCFGYYDLYATSIVVLMTQW